MAANLAGRRIEEANRSVRADLIAADIPEVNLEPTSSAEVRATIGGQIDLPGHRLRFVRGWSYWTVDVAPAFSVEDAAWIDERPLSCSAGAYYSGGDGILGDVARAHGFAGGIRPGPDVLGGKVDGYHIDTVAGLCVFVRTVRERFLKKCPTCGATR